MFWWKVTNVSEEKADSILKGEKAQIILLRDVSPCSLVEHYKSVQRNFLSLFPVKKKCEIRVLTDMSHKSIYFT
jgi:hypothetical protein